MEQVTDILNHDIIGLVSRINRFIVEAMRNASANTSETTEADIIRLKTYLSSIRFYVDFVNSAPILDITESSPKVYPVPAPPVVDDVESEAMQDMCRLLELAREELLKSQSARKPAGLISFDSVRLMLTIAKCEAFIVDYIEKSTPLDLPQSSPMSPRSAPGKRGA